MMRVHTCEAIELQKHGCQNETNRTQGHTVQQEQKVGPKPKASAAALADAHGGFTAFFVSSVMR